MDHSAIPAGLRVLVVEDDYLIGLDIADVLTGLGTAPIGPVCRMADALAALEDGKVDFAVLDLDLDGTPTYRIADALMQRGVPFVFVTGYSAETVSPAYRDHPRLEKPVETRALAAALIRGR